MPDVTAEDKPLPEGVGFQMAQQVLGHWTKRSRAMWGGTVPTPVQEVLANLHEHFATLEREELNAIAAKAIFYIFEKEVVPQMLVERQKRNQAKSARKNGILAPSRKIITP